jgi:hypothetical protein
MSYTKFSPNGNITRYLDNGVVIEKLPQTNGRGYMDNNRIGRINFYPMEELFQGNGVIDI